MYMRDLSGACSACERSAGMAGLSGIASLAAVDPFSIVSGVLSLTRSLGTPTAGGAAAGGTTVQTSVQTNVNPQISPVFVQQDSPSNSPVNAATVQTSPSPQSSSMGMPTAANTPTPGLPMTGAIPGVDYASGYAPTGTPLYPSVQSSGDLKPEWLIAGLGLIGAIAFAKRGKKTKAKRR